MKRKSLPLCVALLSLVCAASAAQAQESTAYGTSEYGGGWAVPSLDVSQSIIRDRINQRMLDDQVLGKNRSDSSDTQAEDSAAAALLSFVGSAKRRILNYSRFIAQNQAVNPGAAKFYDQMFATNRYFDRLDASLQAKGLKSNSIADAFAAYWMSSWLASRSRQSSASVKQAAVTKTVAIEMLAKTPSLASMTDAAKQEVADDLLIKAGLLDGLMALSASDGGARKTIAQAARQGAQKWGLDLDAMELTEKGFVFVRQ